MVKGILCINLFFYSKIFFNVINIIGYQWILGHFIRFAVTTITTIMNDNNRLIYPKYFAYHVIAFGTFHFDVNHYPYFFRHTHQPALISRLEVKRSINTLSTSVFGTPQVSSILNHNVKI